MSKIKIADFAEVITGGTPSTSNPEYWENGDVPWLQSGACQNDVITGCDTFITQKGLENSAAKMMKPDSVLIALTGATTGKVGYLTFEACANQSVTGIQPNERFVSKYLYYYLRGIRKKILDDSYGGAQKHISQGYVKNIEVPLGSIEEQKTITKLLETVDTTIALRQQELKLLDDLIKARFVEMFGDTKSNPFGFEKRPLRETCTVITGNTPSRSVPEYYGDSIEWIKTDNIVVGQLNPSQAVEYLSDEGVKVGRTVEKDAILMACIAGSVASIGRVCITDRKVAFNQQINAVVPKDYDSLFLHAMLQLSKEYLVEEINMALKGILSKSKLESKEFIVPPMNQQKEFAAFVTRVDKSKLTVQQGLDKLELLKQSLMQQYFG